MVEPIRPSTLAIQAESSKISRRLSKKFFVTALVCILFFGVAGSLTINPVKAFTSPPGIVAYVEITVTNSQQVSTPSPFQQMITVNSAAYGTYEASNLQNIEFFDSLGNIIPSWLESGNSNKATSTVYWLNLEGGIPAESNLTIYMGFAIISTNLLSAQTTGEAPQLSQVYGEYDNGAKVFPFYDGFSGLSLSSQWSVPDTGGSYAVNNGLTVYGGGSWESIVSNTKFNPQSQVFDSCSYFTGSTGFISPNELWGWNPAGTTFPQYVIADTSYGHYTLYNHNDVSGATTEISGGSTSSYQIWSLWTDTTRSYLTLDYSTTVSNSGGFGATTSAQIGIGQASQNYQNKVQWVRIRNLPPNSVTPNVTFQNTTIVQGPFPLLMVALISISLLVIVVIAVLLYVRKKRTGKGSGTNDKHPFLKTSSESKDKNMQAQLEHQTGQAPSDSLQRLQKLKDMLDRGLITQQDYDEQKKKIVDQT